MGGDGGANGECFWGLTTFSCHLQSHEQWKLDIQVRHTLISAWIHVRIHCMSAMALDDFISYISYISI